MIVLVNVIKPQGLEPLQFPTKFRSHSPRMLTMAGQLEIVDRRVVYTEGPHRKGAEAKYDVVADPSGIVGRLARLASLFDQQSQKLRAGA